MASNRPTRAVTADLTEAGATDLPLDHALSLLLADETENALRWGAAVLESGPWTPSALVVTARLLDQMGRRRAAIEGLKLAVQQAIAEGDLPLAMAATGDLRSFGAEVDDPLDQIAAAFCEGSDRLRDAQTAPLLPQFGEFRPLSPFLTGPALASKAAQIVESVRRTEHDDATEAPSRIAPLPLFSALGKEALHDLLAAFDTLTVPAGHAVIREGEEEAAAYIVARGELEVSRRSNDENGKPMVLARLGSGAFFGEMALLSQLPGAASVIATRPSILLVARRDALEAVVERHPEVAAELAAHCRRQSVANLGWASPVVVAIPPRERATMVEHFETRMFEAGDRLVEAGEEALGLHLIVSGEIGVVANESGERVLLATLTAGETVGEVELVLCRNSVADAVAVRPTATLFLPRDEFFALVQDHPAILHGLYGIAVRRHAETNLALGAGSSEVADESLLGKVPGDLAALVEDAHAPTAVEPADPGPQRITPLGRGTLGLPRVSPPPPRTSSIPPLPPPPAVPRSTLPPPPMSPRVAKSRSSFPPPIPPPIPTPAPRSEVPARSLRSSSVSPMTATTGPVRALERPPATQPRAMAGVAVAAIAAAAIGFVTVRGLREATPSPPSATAGTLAATIVTPASPPPPVSTEIPSGAQKPIARPKASAPPVLAKTKVVVEPSPVVVAGSGPASSSPAAASAPATVVPTEALAPPEPSRQTFPTAKPSGADQAISAGEFGGRE